MALRVDMTGDRFDMVTFGEATIFFDPSWQQRGTKIAFPAWGATLISKNLNLYGVNLKIDYKGKPDDIYIAGYSWLEFEGVSAGKLVAFPYNTAQNPITECIKDMAGQFAKLSNEWGCSQKNAIEYVFDGTLAWPYASSELFLMCSGSVSLIVEPSEFIAAGTYIDAPKEYMWYPSKGSPTKMPVIDR